MVETLIPQVENPIIGADLEYEYETEELYADYEGQKIFSVLYRPTRTDGPLPVVIFAHGFAGSYMFGGQYADALAKQGHLVYCFDFRGGSNNSRSEGSVLDMSIFTEQSDLEAVIDMLQDRDEVDNKNIFLLGAS